MGSAQDRPSKNGCGDAGERTRPAGSAGLRDTESREYRDPAPFRFPRPKSSMLSFSPLILPPSIASCPQIAKLSAAAKGRGPVKAEGSHMQSPAEQNDALWGVEVGSYLMHMKDQPQAAVRTQPSRRGNTSSDVMGASGHRGSRTPSPIRDLWKGFRAGFRPSQERLDATQDTAPAQKREATGAVDSKAATSGVSSGSSSPARSSSPLWSTMKVAFSRNKKKLSCQTQSGSSAPEVSGARTRGLAEAQTSNRENSEQNGRKASLCSSRSSFSESLADIGVPLNKADDGMNYIDPEDALQLLCEHVDPHSGSLSPDRNFTRRRSSSPARDEPTLVRVPSRTERSYQKLQSPYAAVKPHQQYESKEECASPESHGWLKEISLVSKRADSMHRAAAELLEESQRVHHDQPDRKRENHLKREQLKAQLDATKAALQVQLNRITSEFDAALNQASFLARPEACSPSRLSATSASPSREPTAYTPNSGRNFEVCCAACPHPCCSQSSLCFC